MLPVGSSVIKKIIVKIAVVDIYDLITTLPESPCEKILERSVTINKYTNLFWKTDAGHFDTIIISCWVGMGNDDITSINFFSSLQSTAIYLFTCSVSRLLLFSGQTLNIRLVLT